MIEVDPFSGSMVRLMNMVADRELIPNLYANFNTFHFGAMILISGRLYGFFIPNFADGGDFIMNLNGDE